MTFMKLNGLFAAATLAMNNSRDLNEIKNLIVADPRAIDTLTMSEKGLLILFVAGLGMAVTFAVLLFLWLAIEVVSKVLNSGTNRTTKVKKIDQPVIEEGVSEDDSEDEALIAVIAAAVAASMNTSIHNIVVKNVVRVNDHAPSWAKTGRIEQINTRF